MSATKEIKRMFERLLISNDHDLAEFLMGELNEQPWLLKVPVKETFANKKGLMTRVRLRPRVTYKGKVDYLHRQLYRHFVSDDIAGRTLLPVKNREDYNPFHWKLSGVVAKAPVSVKTAPTVIDPEVLDLVTELKRREALGLDVWDGVSEMFTDLEIAQAKELMNDEVTES